MKFWLVFGAIFGVVVTVGKCDQRWPEIPRPALRIEPDIIYDVGGVCVGDVIFMDCEDDEIDWNSALRSLKRSVIITDGNETIAVVNRSDTNDNYNDWTHRFILPAEESQVGKRYRYTCLVGNLPYVDGQLQLEKCHGNRPYNPVDYCKLKPNAVDYRRANYGRTYGKDFQHWNCTVDDPVQYVVTEGETTTLYCNGMTTNSKVLWFHEHRIMLDSPINEDKLQITDIKSSYAGVYACLTYSESTGKVSKQYIDVDVIPANRPPTDLRFVRDGDDLVITWNSNERYTDQAGRTRPRTAGLLHRVWYRAVLKAGSKETDIHEASAQYVETPFSNVTLKNVDGASLYLVSVRSRYGDGEWTPLTYETLLVDSATNTIEEVRKFGDKLDIKCGSDKFALWYETPAGVKRSRTDNEGRTEDATVTEESLQGPVLPEDAGVYKCSGKATPFPRDSSTMAEPIDVHFVVNLRVQEPDPDLPSVVDLRCTEPTNSSFSISWSVNQSVNSESMKVVLLRVHGSDREAFTTNLNAKSYHFDQLSSETPYIVWIAVQDDLGRQSELAYRRCLTARYI